MSELKRCPFCGGEAKLMKFSKCERKYVVICENVQCMASVGNYSYSKEKAIEAWNTRKPMQNIVKWLEEKVQEWYRERVSCMRILNYESARQAMNMMGVYKEVIEILKEEGGL